MSAQNWLRWPVLATWRVPEEHPVLPGHFPGYSVVPGALLLDWVIGHVAAPADPTEIHVRAARFHAAASAGMLLRAHAHTEGGRTQFAVVADSDTLLCAGTLDGATSGASS